MLTRLRVSGFKNLVDVDVSFDTFTCIAGANGVGKSNLLDAILFLSALADRTLLDAALSVRDQGAKTGDIRGLFHHVGDRFDEEMTFEAEMVIPEEGTDDLGQQAKASSTFVQYTVGLRYKKDESARALGSLELVKEELKHITLREAPQHQDGGSSGKPQKLRAANLPRTVLSAANSAESPTATLVKREMQSWRLLQLEPSALREPDSFTAPGELASDGAHLPAALYQLANSKNGDSAAVYFEVANKLSQIIEDVRSVSVDRDERRELLTLYATGSDGTAYPARALSDGTLRFLALAVLSLAHNPRGLICMEEPENGIHPERISAMIQLLQDLTTDTQAMELDDERENPLWQVIINTHSPSVVMQVPDDSLIMAEAVEVAGNGPPFKALRLRCLPGTWREKSDQREAISRGSLLAYLNPVSAGNVDSGRDGKTNMERKKPQRVIDRQDLHQYKLPFPEHAT
jgi:predicted ATPase